MLSDINALEQFPRQIARGHRTEEISDRQSNHTRYPENHGSHLDAPISGNHHLVVHVFDRDGSGAVVSAASTDRPVFHRQRLISLHRRELALGAIRRHPSGSFKINAADDKLVAYRTPKGRKHRPCPDTVQSRFLSHWSQAEAISSHSSGRLAA
jgi:hypothetical protein